MAKKRGETTSGNNDAAGASSGVSPVRGNNAASPVPDLSGVGGVPGVQPSNSDGKNQEVSGSPEAVAKRTLKTLNNLDLEEKISLLNALKDLLRHTPKIKTDADTQSLIARLYRQWVCDIMDQVLNQKNPAQAPEGFTSAETNALKLLAHTILSRQQSAPGAQPKGPTPMGPGPNAAPMKPSAPLNPGINSESYRNAQATFLSELAKLDQQDPDAKWRNY